MRLRTSPYLTRATVARSRALRRNMTPAERKLSRALREALPDVHFRHQVPLGPYYADLACHAARLVIEVDGGQHGEERDAGRTRFMEGEGYRVLRFWNNEVMENLDGVLRMIADALPSPLVGCAGEPRPTRLSPVRGTGRPAHGGAKRRMGGARRSRARASGSHPLPSPPHKGEGGNVKPPVWSS